jgi:hypothetical protein
MSCTPAGLKSCRSASRNTFYLFSRPGLNEEHLTGSSHYLSVRTIQFYRWAKMRSDKSHLLCSNGPRITLQQKRSEVIVRLRCGTMIWVHISARMLKDVTITTTTTTTTTTTPWHYSPDRCKPPLIRFHSLIQCIRGASG